MNRANKSAEPGQPVTADAFYRRATAKAEKRDWVGALNDFSRAIALAPAVALYYFCRAEAKWQRAGEEWLLFFCPPSVHHGERDLTLASILGDYTHACNLAPQVFYHFHNRGMVRELMGDAEGSLADFTTAISVNPDAALSYRARGLLKLRMGREREARLDLDRALELMPQLSDDLAEAIAFARRCPHPLPDDGIPTVIA